MLRSQFSMLAIALFAFAGVFTTSMGFAGDGPVRAAGHDPVTMQKAEKKISDSLSTLSAADQKLAKVQRFCPIMIHDRLGAMGTDAAGLSIIA